MPITLSAPSPATSPDSFPLPRLPEPLTPSLLRLPLELQFLMTSHLPWPDLLALRHSHPYFYYNIPTTVRQRVAWLISLEPCDLRFPRENVNMKTDADFCRSYEIKRLLRMRRCHLDCHRDGKHCLTVEGQCCSPHADGVSKGARAVIRNETFRRLSHGGLSLCSMRLLWAMLGLLIALLVAWIVKTHKGMCERNFEAKLWSRGLIG